MPSADHAASLPATFPVRLGALGVRESPSPLSLLRSAGLGGEAGAGGRSKGVRWALQRMCLRVAGWAASHPAGHEFRNVLSPPT